MCTLDPDGDHQPVRIKKWNNEPGPLANGDKLMDKRYTSLNHWTQKLFFDLFEFLEPSLFCGAVRPTDSNTVLRQLMERCFGYNTGVVFGQTATTLSIQKRTKREQFFKFRDDYINNGRPLRKIRFENQIELGLMGQRHLPQLPCGNTSAKSAATTGKGHLRLLCDEYVNRPVRIRASSFHGRNFGRGVPQPNDQAQPQRKSSLLRRT